MKLRTWLGAVILGLIVGTAAPVYTQGPFAAQIQAAIRGLTFGTTPFTYIKMGTGSPSATRPFDGTFSANTNIQFLWFNNNVGASAAAEGCFKTDTIVGCISAQGVNSSTDAQRMDLYTNAGTGGTSGNPGWNIVSCYSATPTLCNTRFFTNTTDGINGERLRINATGLTLANSAIILGTDGTNNNPTYSFVSDPDTGFYWGGSGAVVYAANAVRPVQFSGNGVFTGSDGSFQWTNAAANATTTVDTNVSRSAAGVVAIGTGASGSTVGAIALGGAAPAASGAIRLANTAVIVARNAANSGDGNLLSLSNGNVLLLGQSITSSVVGLGAAGATLTFNSTTGPGFSLSSGTFQMLNDAGSAALRVITGSTQVQINGGPLTIASAGTNRTQITSTANSLAQLLDGTNGTTGTEFNQGVPTLGTCTGGSITSGSHNIAGEYTGNTSSSCVINFGTPNFTNTPFCFAMSEASTTHPRISAKSASSITVTGGVSGEAIQFFCLGRIGT